MFNRGLEDRHYELTEIYAENESAWRNGHQKELARLLGDLRSGRRKFDILLVWSLDRLSRQGIGAILQLISTFETHDCQVISIQESWTVADINTQTLWGHSASHMYQKNIFLLSAQT